MKMKKFFTRKADDPMGALNDLSFLLIIYFLVIAGFNTNLGFLMNLPSREKPRIVQKEDLIRLVLNPDGDLYYRDEIITLPALEEVLIKNFKAHPNLTVALSIHPETEYQNFIKTIEIIRKQKVENFSFSLKDTGIDQNQE